MTAPKTSRTLYRVRYWRPGWARGKDGANSKAFWTEHAARRFIERLEAADVTPAGAIVYSLSTCEATPWKVGDEIDTGARWP